MMAVGCRFCEIEDCDDRDQVNFCEECKEYLNCDLKYVTCKAGHSIECNNGFEEKDELWEDDNGEL